MKCQRCGTCCRKGPPCLHGDDKHLYFSGVLKKNHLLTLRKGERVYDNIQGHMITLSEEMVRLQAKTNERSCLFYEDLTQDCLIYAHRPLECRVMKCWDTQEIKRVYSQDRVKRLDLIPADSALGEIIREHEQQCSIDVLKEALKEMKMARNERALQTISSIISQDETFRDYMKKRAKTQDDTLSFLFGRPIKDIMKTFGFTLLSTETGHPDKIIASGTI